MNIFLGDEVTLLKDGTSISGQVSGIVLDDARNLERIYIHGIEVPFWFAKGWAVVDYDTEEDNGEI